MLRINSTKPFIVVPFKAEFDAIVAESPTKNTFQPVVIKKHQQIIIPKYQIINQNREKKNNAKIRKNYIRIMNDGCLPKGTTYEVDQIDLHFIKSKKSEYEYLTPEILANMMKMFDQSFYLRKGPKKQVLAMLFPAHLEKSKFFRRVEKQQLINLVYSFWSYKRFTLHQPIIRVYQTHKLSQPFKKRQQDKMTLRNSRKTSKIMQFNNVLDNALMLRKLLLKIIERETTELEIIQLQQKYVEQSHQQALSLIQESSDKLTSIDRMKKMNTIFYEERGENEEKCLNILTNMSNRQYPFIKAPSNYVQFKNQTVSLYYPNQLLSLGEDSEEFQIDSLLHKYHS